MKDYYRILRVHPSVSEEEVKEAYRRLAHKYHPDVAGGDATKFKEIHEAYEALSDPGKRREYDASLNPTHHTANEGHQERAANPVRQRPVPKKKTNTVTVIVALVVTAFGLVTFFSAVVFSNNGSYVPQNAPTQSAALPGTSSSNFSVPYPVTWSEGQLSFAISGATLVGDELTLMVNVTMGDTPQCVPINLRLVTDEEGDMVTPATPAQTDFPLNTDTCEGTPDALYPNEPLTFTVDPTNTPFLLTTGGTSNVYFEVTTTTDGGLDVAIPQQSG